MTATLSPAELARRARMFARSLGGETVAPGRGTGFWFDPAYADFLEGVRRATPPDATIALVVPSRPDLYVYEAAYQLAPRRIVSPEREGEATWIAAYRYQFRPGPNPDVVEVPNGALFRRR